MLGLWLKPAWIGVGAYRFQGTHASDRKSTSPWMLGVGGSFEHRIKSYSLYIFHILILFPLSNKIIMMSTNRQALLQIY